MINIIDPGHDNQFADTGATAKIIKAGEAGQRLILEADLNIKVANRVKSNVENYQGVVMTREWDTPGFTTLQQRVGIAVNQHWSGGGMYSKTEMRFISIHHNSYHNPDVSGLEVYYKDGCQESKYLAYALYENIRDAADHAGYMLVERGVKTAPFYVLRNTPCPAVLIENGFMSNPIELEWLTSPVGQITHGYAIARTLLERS